MPNAKQNLVIVESPSKAKTIGKYLGPDYQVKASMGHLRDLPKSTLSVDIEHDFEPEYQPLKGKEDIIADLRKAAKGSGRIYLATDPDREGEAISWHLKYLLNIPDNETYRVTFNEITRNVVQESIQHPRPIDQNLVDAQQARRVLDRIVGYQLSPLLWKKIRKGLSAGRVQSVATRLVVDRENEIRAFVPQEYWTLDVNLNRAGKPGSFTAHYYGDPQKRELTSEQDVQSVLDALEGQPFSVTGVKKSEKKRTPAPPFITSTLQQEASRKLNMTPRRTMMIAQDVYKRQVLAQALGSDSYSGIVSLVRNILRGTAAVEGAGALILFFRFLPEFGFGKALWYGVFHSISAFCNAGFDVLADTDAGGSLCRYATDPVVNFTIMALIIIGGLGFAVWGDIRHNRRFSRMSVYTRLVILITTVLIFGGAGIFAALEWNNPGTLGGLTPSQKLMAALFQSVTLRTAGFATFDQNALSDVSKAVADFLMLVGGSSGSTAGGVKTVTVGVILLAAWSTARGRTSVQIMKRRIPQQAVANASALFILVLLLSGLGAAFLSIADHVSLENALYETISALCTVGLTTGITSSLCAASQIVLIIFMFFGRLGIMTISVGFMAADRAEERVSYAETKIMIG